MPKFHRASFTDVSTGQTTLELVDSGESEQFPVTVYVVNGKQRISLSELLKLRKFIDQTVRRPRR